jgi:phospholipid transport system transporter-binding protein
MATGRVDNGALVLSGPLTFATVGDHFRDSREWFSGPEPVAAVELGGVDSVDSAGLALLLEWQAQAVKRGARLAYQGAPAELLRLAALAEASELLGLEPVPELAHDDLG